MNLASTIASRWTVSTRTRGELLTASVSVPGLELVLLGIPATFTEPEAEGWLRDLAGVANETSREDTRARAIPPLLHHALTGLLFSQAELWSQPGHRGPCSVAFVESADGPGFGWVGEARVNVMVDGSAFEPQWVIVRDQDGREARAALLPGARPATLAIEFWPGGEDGSEAPVAIEAEWLVAGMECVTAIPASMESPTPAAHAEPPAESAAALPLTPMPESIAPASLPLQQPGIAAPAHEQHAGEHAAAPGGEAGTEVPRAPSHNAERDDGETLGPHVTAVLEALQSGTMLLDEPPAGRSEEDATRSAQHPVGRWLGRLLSFGKRIPRKPGPEAATDEAPLSTYDSLLSASVPPTVLEPAEQTSLELPPVAPPMLVEPDAPGFVPLAAVEASFANVEILHAPIVEMESRVEHTAAVPATPAAPPEYAIELAPIEASGLREDVVRAMREVDAASLPVLPTPPGLATYPSDEPLQIDHEPVGADVVFAIPRVPVRPAAPPVPPVVRVLPVVPVLQPVVELEPLAAIEPQVATRPEPVAPLPGPVPPFVSRVHVRSDTPAAPPKLHVAWPTLGVESPPLVQVPLAPLHASSAAPESGAYAGADAEADAGASTSLHVPPAIARRPWPALEAPPSRRLPKRAWVWAGIVAAVFAAGWLVGVVTNPTEKGVPGPFTRLLRVVGLASPHFVASINSTPNGAWIAVDGKDVARRTPADIELSPGAHTIKLSIPELGGTEVPVQGARNEKVTSNTSLNGGLEVYSSDANVPISVSLDGRDVGYAPVSLESVVPGLHELQFTGPGMPAWAQTVQVGVRRNAQVVAHPMSAPANGVVQVQATLNDERGASPLSGAQVFVDGQLRGVTPASFELPRGPHSLKLRWRDETAPVQVIELPGGNQRFASFNFGLDTPSPQLVLLGGVHPAGAQEQVIVSATLTTLQVGDVREAWLHVSTPDGLWRRYAMTAMAGARGPVLVCMFPPASLSDGSARWYVSASTPQGDEYFSEMQSAAVGAPGDVASGPRRRAAGTPTP